MTRAKFLTAFFALLMGMSMLSLPASADLATSKIICDGAKARGIIGEQGDGFLAFLAPPQDQMLVAAVSEINAGRAQAYRDTAARTGVTPQAAGEATFAQLLANLPPGQFYRPLTGPWTRR